MKQSLRLLVVFLAGLMGLALSACNREEPKPPAPEVRYFEKPLASVAGEVGVPTDTDGFGITVFAEGTSFIALTNEQGEFVLSGLPAGQYRLRAMRSDLQSAIVGNVTVTDADLKKTQPFQKFPRLLMEPRAEVAVARAEANRYGALRGTVATEQPGEEGDVLIAVEGKPIRAATLPDGSWEMPRLEAGTVTLVFTKAGYGEERVPFNVVANVTTDVPAVKMEGQGASLAATRTIFGRVDLLMADGTAGIDQGTVRVAVEGSSFAATPDAAGRYEIRNVPAGVYVVTASAPKFLLEQKITVDLTAVTSAEANLSLLEDTLQQAGTGVVAGLAVLDEPGAAGNGGVSVSLLGSNYVASTDRQGAFQINGVAAGNYELVASLSGYESATFAGVIVTNGQTVQVPKLVLKKIVDAPILVSTSPGDGATDVKIEQPTLMTLQFSRSMDTESVKQAVTIAPRVDFQLVSGRGGVGGAESYVIQMNAVPAEGTTALAYSTQYTVTVSRLAKSLDGVPLKEAYTVRFTTGDPMVIATMPTDGEQDFRWLFQDPFYIYFNAPIDRSSVAQRDIEFSPSLPALPNLIWSTDSKTGWSILKLQGRAEADTVYNVTIARGARTITGQRVTNMPYRFQFKTRRWSTFDERYGLTTPAYDPAERERERQPRRQ